jgi:hypothetical protein
MNQEQLKLIYEYMAKADWGMGKWFIGDWGINHPFSLDSNAAWECVQEMESREEVDEFMTFVFDTTLGKSGKYLALWLYNPDNFFNCFSKYLEGRKNERKT